MPAEPFEIQDTLWTAGVLEGAPEQEFGRIRDAAIDPDGNVYLLDSSARVVRVFGADGGFRFIVGGSGRGPGELMDPRVVTHDGSDMLYVLDSQNGLLAFHVDGDGARLVRVLDIGGAGVRASDVCTLMDRIYVFGRALERPLHESTVLHEFDRTGRLLRSFGRLFGSDRFPSHPVLEYLNDDGSIGCAPGGILMAMSGQLSEVRLYNVAESGRLATLWIDSIPEFVEVWVQIEEEGGYYAVGDPGSEGRDRVASFLRLQDETFLVQSRRLPFASREEEPREIIESCVVDASIGVCSERSTEFPLILAILGDRAVVSQELVFPSVALVDVEYGGLR